MPKRKITKPVRLLNHGENWGWVSGSKENDSLDISNEDYNLPTKSLKLATTKKITSSVLRFTAKNEKFFLGSFHFGTSKNVFPDVWKKCKITSSNGDILKLNFDSGDFAIVQLTADTNFILEMLTTKIFSYDFHVNIIKEIVNVSLYIQLPLLKYTVKIGEFIKKVIHKNFKIEIKDMIKENQVEKHCENLDDFYRDINACRNSKKSEENDNIFVQHPSLLPKLRPYQSAAVKWMIKREKVPEITETLHPMYVPVTLNSGEIIYFNVYTGYIEIVEPLVSSLKTGGILADEMGLGKTVEVLACILNNPRIEENVINEENINLVENLQNEIKMNINEEIGESSKEHYETENKIITHEEITHKEITHEKNVDKISHEEIDDKKEITHEEIVDKKEITNENLIDISDENNITKEPKIEVDKTVPKIETQLKYKKPKIKKIKEKIQKDKLKTNIDDAKKKPKKSAAKIAAQIWYENKLAEMQIKVKRKPREEVEVQCICGDFNRIGIVHCSECKKMQHFECMGYKDDILKYCCPQCWINKPHIKSKATLIVSPISISRQWSLEIQRHVRKNGLRVLIYKGINKGGVMYPTDLADYDLVVTTYSVLQSELKFSNEDKCLKSFRYAKRYNSPNTPLLNIEWWRLCLDEAQTVDCPTSQVSLMAHQLDAVHRWAVTGTPIQKNISDLYGLIDYLKLSPYDDRVTWENMLYLPYLNDNKEPMINFLSEVMWRSAKADVLEQIDIPPQTIEEHWYEFSAVEKYFYKREHNLSASDFLNKLKTFESLDITLTSIDRKVLSKILVPLLSLRQACIHPHAVRGRYLAKCKINSMEGLLEALIKKNIKECEESLRAVLAALNGMAGLLLLKGNSLDAIESYRNALHIISKYDNHEFIKIDKLQRIHTLYNLSEVLADKSYPTPPPTLRDDKLREECEQVQRQYMDKYISEARSAFMDAETATKAVNKKKKKFKLDEGEWFCELNDWLLMNSLDDELIKKIQNTMDYEQCKIKYEDISSTRSVMYLLTTWQDKVNKHLEKVQKLFQQFKNEYCTSENEYHVSEKIVNDAMECHLRPAKNKKIKKSSCLCCLLDSNLKKYECVIFQMKIKFNKENESNKGTWHPSFEERLLKVIYTFGKQKGAEQELLSDGETHLALCEALRKEFKELRRLYTIYDQQVSAQDELNICKIRFRLSNPEEPVKVIEKKKSLLKNLDYEVENKYEFINVLNEFDLDYNYSQLFSEKDMAEEKLKKVIGTHSYLETLKKQQYSGQDPDPCPICGNKLVDSWSILQCGHCYCLECIDKLLERFKVLRHVTCSVCRKKQLCDDISYIKVKGTGDKCDDIDIQGSYSTKIQAIIKSVIELKKEDETVKILIFSTWQTVLNVISEAFGKNNISYEHISTYNLQEKLENFKDEKKGVTACLLPVNLGAKGLNLIEATHVFLAEPLMNPGEELQAIGRVHRIGQTKPTFVHRFLIKNTIEENIHNAVSTNTKQWDKNKLTLLQLKNLFVDCDTNIPMDNSMDNMEIE